MDQKNLENNISAVQQDDISDKIKEKAIPNNLNEVKTGETVAPSSNSANDLKRKKILGVLKEIKKERAKLEKLLKDKEELKIAAPFHKISISYTQKWVHESNALFRLVVLLTKRYRYLEQKEVNQKVS